VGVEKVTSISRMRFGSQLEKLSAVSGMDIAGTSDPIPAEVYSGP
jgi:hypothetical protein